MAISKTSLEKNYGLNIIHSPYWSITKQRIMTGYEVYTADGCHWGSFSTIKQIEKECQKYGKDFMNIKKMVAEKR